MEMWKRRDDRLKNGIYDTWKEITQRKFVYITQYIIILYYIHIYLLFSGTYLNNNGKKVNKMQKEKL